MSRNFFGYEPRDDMSRHFGVQRRKAVRTYNGFPTIRDTWSLWAIAAAIVSGCIAILTQIP